MHTLSRSNGATQAALLIGILLIAANLRGPITAMPPLLAQIQADFGLGTTAAGALTTLPLLAFALLSPSVHYLPASTGWNAPCSAPS